MDRKELQEPARIRLKEAQALLELGWFDGAFYLAGYSVECALKACIAKTTQRGDFPDRRRAESSHSHNLAQLCKVAGLDEARLIFAAQNPAFLRNWELTVTWNEESRYRKHSSESSRGLLEAVSDRRHGVLTWIRQRW